VRFRLCRGMAFGVLNMAVAGPVGAGAVHCVALVGRDYPGVVFDLAVGEGDRVDAGQVLACDRHRPEIVFVAPVAGRVSRIGLGARRRLEALEIEVGGDGALAFDVSDALGDGAALRRVLLASGVWAGFRTRPFGHVPGAQDQPAAIFVNAMESEPCAPDTLAVLAPQIEDFRRGAEALRHLTSGPVIICQAEGEALLAAGERLEISMFCGLHPVGLAGTHMHHVMPVSRQRVVWQINAQDVAAIGHLLATGRIMGQRVISVAGSGVDQPGLMQVPLGARLADLAQDAGQWLSGSVLSGQRADYLGRYDVQASLGGLYPSMDRPFWHRLLDHLPAAPIGATLPNEEFERVWPFDILPVPLMRALAVGDVETAERLGCLELLEEDMALLSHLCPSGNDYGALLRHTLDILAQEGAV